jgi:hypothetical protein
MTTQPTLFAAPAYAGWQRTPPGRWHKVCRSDSLAACWPELLALPAGRHCERVVLRAGIDPTRRRARSPGR